MKPAVHIIFVPDRPVLSILHNNFSSLSDPRLNHAAQTTTFFEHADQMGIPHTTVVQLCAEGIEAVADLADFDKDSLQQLADNLRHPGGCVLDPNPGAPAGATIPTPPFVSIKETWIGASPQARIVPIKKLWLIGINC